MSGNRRKSLWPTLRSLSRIPTSLSFHARDPDCQSNHIGLTRFYNVTLINSWSLNPDSQDNNLSNLPTGLQMFDGIDFDIRGIVYLAGSHPDLKAPIHRKPATSEWPLAVERFTLFTPAHIRSRRAVTLESM